MRKRKKEKMQWIKSIFLLFALRHSLTCFHQCVKKRSLEAMWDASLLLPCWVDNIIMMTFCSSVIELPMSFPLSWLSTLPIAAASCLYIALLCSGSTFYCLWNGRPLELPQPTHATARSFPTVVHNFAVPFRLHQFFVQLLLRNAIIRSDCGSRRGK